MSRRGDVLGQQSLDRFDFCIVGSGAGGGTAAHVLTAAGKTVLVLEAGHNPFPGLDRPGHLPLPLHSNDELKYQVRDYIQQQSFLEPRTFREDTTSEGNIEADVNVLPKAVGGAFQHADCAVPRFNKVDFELVDAMARARTREPSLEVPGFFDAAGSASFVNWPFRYDDLEPFYAEAEDLYGVQGLAGDNVFESDRKGRPYPMSPGVPMYFNLLMRDAARSTMFLGEPLHPHVYPKAINSEFRDGRPPCVDCGWCSHFGCPNNSKGSPAVTALRRALLTKRCQLRFNAAVVRLLHSGGQVTGVEYVDDDGKRQTATADFYILAASAIESARLCLLSDPDGPGLGNSSGQVGRNLMFHLQTLVSGFMPQRVHGQRGRSLTHGMSDFRGVVPAGEEIRVVDDAGGKHAYMGGICEFSASQGLPITEDGFVYALQIPRAFGGYRSGIKLKNALRDQALGQHLVTLVMQAEDAPQPTNFVDLDKRYRDVYGSYIARVTYKNHAYEATARRFYIPQLMAVLETMGARNIFAVPCNPVVVGPPDSRHVMGTLRMGDDKTTSVTDGAGKFHDLDNLYACDGSVFPTSSGYNPTLTIIAVALRIAHGIVRTPPAV